MGIHDNYNLGDNASDIQLSRIILSGNVLSKVPLMSSTVICWIFKFPWQPILQTDYQIFAGGSGRWRIALYWSLV